MSNWIFVLIAVSCVPWASIAEHRCIHDHPKLQDFSSQLLSAAPRAQFYGKFEQFSPQTIRIAIDDSNLFNNSQFCTMAGEVRPDFIGGFQTCTSEDVFTTSKRSFLLNTVLPAAIGLLRNALNVVPVVGNLTVASRACGGQVLIPASHSSVGVASTDYVLYISAGPTSGTTVAFASACSVDLAGRPIVGFANFGPSNININAANRMSRVAAHELLHALGFSSFFLSRLSGSEDRRGKTVQVVNASHTLAATRGYFGCSTVSGMELEDEGSGGTVGSHWDQRIAAEEVMVGQVSSTMFLSTLTLSALHDTGFYIPNYSAAEPMNWGRGAGCSWFSKPCNASDAGMGTYFCSEFAGRTELCHYDFQGYGTCLIGIVPSLPTWAQYFPSNPGVAGTQSLFDYCPLISTRQRCSTGTDSVITGESFGVESRCVQTSQQFLQVGFVGTIGERRCFPIRCAADGQMQIKVGANDWRACPPSNVSQNITVVGYNGWLVCPSSVVCAVTTTSQSSTPAATTTSIATQISPAGSTVSTINTAAQTTTTTSTVITASTSPTTTSVRTGVGMVANGKLRLRAVAWSRLLSNPNFTVAVLASLTIDLATFLNINVGNLQVSAEMSTPGELLVSVEIRDALPAEWSLSINATRGTSNPLMLSTTIVLYRALTSSPDPIIVTDFHLSDPHLPVASLLSDCGEMGCIVVSVVVTLVVALLLVGVVLMARRAHTLAPMRFTSEPAS